MLPLILVTLFLVLPVVLTHGMSARARASSRAGGATKVWHDSTYDTAIAKTKGSFDPINDYKTEITIGKPDARSILGFWVNYCQTALTDAENIPDLILRINSKSLGISNEEIVIAHGSNDNDANSGYVPSVTEFVPFRNPPGAKLFNAKLSFEAAPSITNTGGLDVVVCVVYANAPPSPQLMTEYLAEKIGRVTGGAYNADAAKAHTGKQAASLSSITVPTGRMRLRGLLGKIQPNGITAGDPISGIMEFSSSDIPDFSPQIFPFRVFYNPALGTVTDGLNSIPKVGYYPTRFPMTGAGATIAVTSTLIITAGADPDTTQAVAYD